MTKKSIHILISVILISLVSCRDEPTFDSSLMIVISNSGNPTNGIVSRYFYPARVLETDVYRFSSTTFRAVITSAVEEGNELCVIKRDDSSEPDKVEIVNTTTWADFRSTNLYLAAGFSRIACLDNKVFVAGSDFFGDLHLIVFNKATLAKEDSIHLADYVEIRDMIVHEDKIYISYNFIDSEPKLLILSSLNYEELDEIDLANICEDLAIDSEGNVMAFHRTGFIKINSSTLEQTHVAFPEANVFYGPGAPSFGFDQKNNIVYYFRYAAQPAPAPFHLSGFKLDSEESVNNLPPDFMDGESLEFDNINGRIVIGSYDYTTNQGLVTLLSTKGKLIDQFYVPNTPVKIIFK